MVWSQSDNVEQKLQPAGLIEPVVVVEVELYSPVVQWVQIMVGWWRWNCVVLLYCGFR